MKSFLLNTLSNAGISITRQVSEKAIRALVEQMHPVTTNKPLIRVGGEGDGGYVITDDLEGIVACFSPGVDVIATFERDITGRGIPCFLADASVEGAPISGPLIHFEKKYIGVINDDTTTTLDAWINRASVADGDLLLQMDIEGAEWSTLLNISEANLKRFRIIAVEVHGVGDLFTRENFQFFKGVMDRLLQLFYVVHNHPNNDNEARKKGDLVIPRLLELSLVRKDRVRATGFANKFPHDLDRKNVPHKRDLPLPRGWYRE